MPRFELGVGVSGVKSAAEQAVKSLNSVTVSAAGAQRMLLGVGVAISGYKFASAASGLSLLAARYETLGIVMTVAGKNIGKTYLEMDKLDKAIQKEGISMLSTRTVLAKMSAAYIDLSKSTELAKAAQNVAVIGNINSSEALERMTGAIVKAEIEMLRTIGINANFEQGYKKMAATLGKTTDNLTEYEKIQSRTNTVLQQAANYNGIYEASLLSAGKQLTTIPRFIENISIMTGELTLDAFTESIRRAFDGLKFIMESMQEMRENDSWGMIGKGAEILNSTLIGVLDNIKEIGIAIGGLYAGRLIENRFIKTPEGSFKSDVLVQMTERTAQVEAQLAAENTKRAEALRERLQTERVAEIANLKAVLKEKEVLYDKHLGDLWEAEARSARSKGLATTKAGGALTASERSSNVWEQRKATQGYEGVLTKEKQALQQVTEAQDRLNKIQVQAIPSVNQLATRVVNQTTAWQRLGTITSSSLSVLGQRLASVGKSVMGFFGGPIGLGITAITAAIAFYETDAQKAEKATNRLVRELDRLNKMRVNDKGVIKTSPSLFTEKTLEKGTKNIKKEVGDLAEEVTETLEEALNISFVSILDQSKYVAAYQARNLLVPVYRELVENLKNGNIDYNEFTQQLFDRTSDVLAISGAFSKEDLGNIFEFVMPELSNFMSMMDIVGSKFAELLKNEKAFREMMQASMKPKDMSAFTLGEDANKLMDAVKKINIQEFVDTRDFLSGKIAEALGKIDIDTVTVGKLLDKGLIKVGQTGKEFVDRVVEYNREAKGAYTRADSDLEAINEEIKRITIAQKPIPVELENEKKRLESLKQGLEYLNITEDTLLNINKVVSGSVKSTADIVTVFVNISRETGNWNKYLELSTAYIDDQVKKSKDAFDLTEKEAEALRVILDLRQQIKDKTIVVGEGDKKGVLDISSYEAELKKLTNNTPEVALGVADLTKAFSNLNEVQDKGIDLSGQYDSHSQAIVLSLFNLTGGYQGALQALENFSDTTGLAIPNIDALKAALQNLSAITLQFKNINLSVKIKGLEAEAKLGKGQAEAFKEYWEIYTKANIKANKNFVPTAEDVTNAYKEMVAGMVRATPEQREQIKTMISLTKQHESLTKSISGTKKETKDWVSENKKLEAEIRAFSDNLVESFSEPNAKLEKLERDYKVKIQSITQEAEKLKKIPANIKVASEIERNKDLQLDKAKIEHEQKILETKEKIADAERKNAGDRLNFYKELAEYMGDYGLAQEQQLKLLEEQVKEWNKLNGISEEHIRLMIELRKLQMATDFDSGIVRAGKKYLAEAGDLAKATEGIFSGLYQGLDSSFKGIWSSILDKGKITLDSFKSLFKNMLAELMHLAVTKPIVVSIASVVTGMFSGGGTAQAGGQAVTGGGLGGLGNFSGLTSLLPKSWTSSISGLMGTTLPGTGITHSLPAGVAGPVGTVGGLGLGSALGYGAAGGLGYNLLGGALGLPQSKYSSVTASLGGSLGSFGGSALGASLGTSGAISGAAAGSAVFPVVGTVLGALAGGLLGGVLGGGKKTKPSVYSGISNIPLSGGLDYEKFFGAGAWYDRQSSGDGKPIFEALGKITEASMGQVQAFIDAVPEEFNKQISDSVSKQTWSAGRGSLGSMGSWNFQAHNMEVAMNEAAGDIQANIMVAFQRALTEVDLSELGVDIDFGDTNWINKAMQGLGAVKEVTKAIDSALDPISEMEAITLQVNATFDAYKEQLEELGVSAWKVAEIDEKRAEVLHKALEPMRKAFEDEYSLRMGLIEQGSTYVAELQYRIQQENELINVTARFGEESAEVMLLMNLQAKELKLAMEDLARANAQFVKENITMRQYVIDGNQSAIEAMQLAIKHENELTEARKRFGEESAEVMLLMNLQAKELKLAMEDLARANAQFVKENITMRQYAIDGNQSAIEAMQLAIKHENELTEARKRFGEDAEEVYQLSWIHAQEKYKLQFAQYQAIMDAYNQDVQNQKNLQDQLKSGLEQAKNAFFSELQSELNRLTQAAEQAKNSLYSALQTEQNRLQGLVDSSRNALISGLQKEINALESAKQATASFVNGLQDLAKNLWLDSRLSIIAPQDQTVIAGENLQEIYQKALAGDKEAYSKFDVATKEFLTKSIESNAQFSDYQKDFLDVQAMITKLRGLSETGNSIEDQQLELLKKELESLQTAEKTLDELRAEYAANAKYSQDFNAKYAEYIAEINKQTNVDLELLIKQMADADKSLADFNNKYSEYIGQLGLNIVNKLEELKAAYLQATADLKTELNKPPVQKPIVTPPTPPVVPPPYVPPAVSPERSLMDIIEAKAKYENKIGTISVEAGIGKGEWTAIKLMDLIRSVVNPDTDKVYTLDEWYEKFGKAEVAAGYYANGGLPPVGKPFWVGEEGPELMQLGTTSRVYSHDDSMAIVSRGGGGDSDLVNAIDALVVENKRQGQQITYLLGIIAKNTKNTTETLDKWDFDGMPKEIVYESN